MHTLPDTSSAAAALVGSLGLHAPDAAAPTPPHDAALAALRKAQVELYCDHDAAAITALRTARQALAGEAPSPAGALASVDEAAWHIRRHAMQAAQTALAQARSDLA